ncbi:MAG: hypothetical protein MJZ20_06970 [Bacteroidaceae bacterium]|nr:hypothetical protein [Bacteroidaceae bacterium]
MKEKIYIVEKIDLYWDCSTIDKVFRNKKDAIEHSKKLKSRQYETEIHCFTLN